jgi:hypothetical protein
MFIRGIYRFLGRFRARLAGVAVLGFVATTALGVPAAASRNPEEGNPVERAVAAVGTELPYVEQDAEQGVNGCNGDLTVYGAPLEFFEGALYYSPAAGGTNCTTTNHRGASYGKAAWTKAAQGYCKEVSPGPNCTYAGVPPQENHGLFKYFAGPVSHTNTSGHCIASEGAIEWNGSVYGIRTNPVATACT